MAILILPPQLANQIAAGEVVERPSSIIKELVENSIDAGANRIDIEVEQGGCKLIRIRDNGCGIAKDELGLALARHATSKISTLDDLEAIVSLGFRGEALASISSVSRLTLTSKPKNQAEAWQVYAEGRDMQPIIKPASHPTGTTVEVLDIFYNTPARRRFLKTEKTEFAHIDEIIRRIALARLDITFNLQHNGKLIKQYRAAESEQQIEKRVAAICGTTFMQKSIKLSWQHDDLLIKGWISQHSGQEALQYFYVNGRVVKDRLLNHALKQAFLEARKSSVYSTDEAISYVIYLELDPRQVDVNVHPAKHEVRFHEARLVHDFVYQAMIMALGSANESAANLSPAGQQAQNNNEFHVKPNRAAAGENIFNRPAAVQLSSSNLTQSSYHYQGSGDKKNTHNLENKIYSQLVQPITNERQCQEAPISPPQQAVISSLFPKRNEPLVVRENELELSSAVKLGRVLTIIDNNYVLLEKHDYQQQQISLLSLKNAQLALFKSKMLLSTALDIERLLIPLSILLSKQEQQVLSQTKLMLEKLNFEFNIDKSKLQLNAVPKLMRKANWQFLLPRLISLLLLHATSPDLDLLIHQWLVEQYALLIDEQEIIWNIPKAIAVLTELEQLHEQESVLSDIIKPVDLSFITSSFKSDIL
ncbi:DNA mismatch repair endonuclease MutL [Orbus sturtevantii]|uniref:DNA mismatch repair endonuclease MutL n=1 Tax=Orbus sturtevantii TaxID=3074109 RepID=UPI00370DDABE